MLEIEVGLPTPPPSSPTYLTTKRPTQRCCLLYLALVLLVLLVLLTSFTTPSHSGLYPPPPDYNRFSSWAAHPTKADDADVVPAECGQNNQATATIDVFYVYPTSFSSNDMQHMNAPINDGQATVLSDAGSLNQQASAFNGVGKIYAPRYRQVSQQGQGSQGQWNNLPRDKNTPLQLAMDVAFSDVLEAFLHYMKVFNDDRPFIIASHSQGTMHAKRLIKYIDAQIHSADGDLAQWMKIKNQIIAAYLIGNTISKENEMPSWLPMCRTPTATKCFVSWNTFVKGSNRDLGAVHWLSKLQQYNMSLNVDQQSYRNLSCACTNPFSWRNDTLNSNSSLHYGSFGLLGSLFLWNFKSRELTVRCDEQDGMLYVDPDPSVLYGWQYSTDITWRGDGELHFADYNLFYRNIRRNAWERTRPWYIDEANTYEEPIFCQPSALTFFRFLWQMLLVGLVVWLFFSLLCCTCSVGCCLLLPKSDRTGVRWPVGVELVLYAFCCCCCIRCVRGGTCRRCVLKHET